MASPSDVLSDVYSYDDDEISRAAAYELQHVPGQGHDSLDQLKRLDVGPMRVDALSVVNVVVPPGPEPVYLVLKTSSAASCGTS